MLSKDTTDSLHEQVNQALEQKSPVMIEGCGSKKFYGYPPAPGLGRLATAEHRGVIDYAPEELVLRVRAGTRLSEINQLLDENQQVLAFEPPDFAGASTIGGVVASGLSGPRRPYAGSVRDFVLGVRLITGSGEILEFGGQVMKNVAGYDVSRLIAGSMGTLGVILDVSLKVLPAPELETTRALAVARQDFRSRLWSIQGKVPISAAAHRAGYLQIRLSGSEAAVRAAERKVGGDEVDNASWDELNRLECFGTASDLWRISVAPASGLFLEEANVIDWGGGLRWLADPGFDPREALAGEDGHATLMKYSDGFLSTGVDVFQPLAEPVLGIQQRLKNQFDPAGVFNPGRLYRVV